WLREYTQLPADATAEDLMADLVTVGLEEEDVHGFDLTGPIVVGKVLEKTPEEHSNGKTINWTQVQVVLMVPRSHLRGKVLKHQVCKEWCAGHMTSKSAIKSLLRCPVQSYLETFRFRFERPTVIPLPG